MRTASNVLAIVGLVLGLAWGVVGGILLEDTVGWIATMTVVMGLLGALIGKLPLALLRFALRLFRAPARSGATES